MNKQIDEKKKWMKIEGHIILYIKYNEGFKAQSNNELCVKQI